MVEAQSAALHGELIGCVRRTVAEYVEQWLTAVQASLEQAGSANYRACLALHVLPRLGHVQRAALTPRTLSSLYADLLRVEGHLSAAASVSLSRCENWLHRQPIDCPSAQDLANGRREP